jgi:PAS domain S-box-containing protein
MMHKGDNTSRTVETIDAQTFRKKFRLLIFNAWNVPAIFGLSFILYVKILSVPEMVAVMTHPLEPLFIVAWVSFSLWYFIRFSRPIVAYLENPSEASVGEAIRCIRLFPIHFWSLFLVYLVMAPVSVIWSAELSTGFVAQPVDWFRINMVALIVSIIVGLPIFFLILDLFGKALTGVPLEKPHITIKTKVFLIGALVPLLIDTMLVQYYWSRTGFFTTETFVVWLFLELLAIAGSLIFVRSFGQSLAPLETVFESHQPYLGVNLDVLKSQSTDEIGVLTSAYRDVLSNLQIQSEMLELNNQLLRKTGSSMSLEKVAESVISLTDKAIAGDKCFLILHDVKTDELICVAQSGAEFKAEGHFRIEMNEPSLAAMTFVQDQAFAITDVQTDPRCNPQLRQRFNIQSALSAPLRLEGKAIGVLMSVSTRIRRDYTARDEAVIQGLAREAALAINTQRLNDQALHAETELAQSSERLGLAIDAGEIGIWEWDIATDRLDWSEKMMKIFGLKPGEFKGMAQDFFDRIYPADAAILSKATSEALEKDAPFNVEHRIVRSDGSVVWVNCRATVNRDKTGKPVGMIGVLTDINVRKEADRILYRFKNTLDMTTDCVFMFDPKTLNFNYVNQGAVNQVGYSEQEMMSMSPVDIKPEYDESEFRQLIQPMLDGEYKQFQFETIHQHKNGDLIPVEISLSYVQSADEPGRFVAIVDNITERKRIEEELGRHREHLEELVDGRTTELRVVNKELEAFAYSVSHDLRAPLRSIDGFSMALLEDYSDKIDEEGRDYLNRVRKSAQTMSNLIDDLLELSRLTRSDFKREDVDLSAISSGVLSELAAQEPERKMDVHIQEGITASGDKRLLKVMMDNLVGNAWKYTGKKEKPKIEFGLINNNGESVYFVRDNGAGFDMKYKDKLFGAFQRLHSSQDFPGTGVGLAIVQRIVQRHGGRTWAEAEPDRGATFYFSLGVNGGGDDG